MNWRRGLIRAWIVGSVAWVIVVVFMYGGDVLHLMASSSRTYTIYVKEPDGLTFSFPAETPDGAIQEALSKYYKGEIQLTIVDRPSPPAVTDPKLLRQLNEGMEPWCKSRSVDACREQTLEQKRQAAIADGRRQTSRMVRSDDEAAKFGLRLISAAAAGPPIILLLIGWALAWVARGLRSEGA